MWTLAMLHQLSGKVDDVVDVSELVAAMIWDRTSQVFMVKKDLP